MKDVITKEPILVSRIGSKVQYVKYVPIMNGFILYPKEVL